MEENILDQLLVAMSVILQEIVRLFYRSLDSLGTLAGYFPAVQTVYELVHGMAYALTIVIAAIAVLMFFGEPIELKSMDTPLGILGRTGIAGFMIAFGSYILDALYNIGQAAFRDLTVRLGIYNSAAQTASAWLNDTAGKIDLSALEGCVNSVLLTKNDFLTILICVFMMAMVLWNIFELLVEVFERYLLIIVLTMVSPLTYATLASSRTASIFKSFLAMYIGGCVQMSVTVIFFSFIISGLQIRSGGQAGLLQMLSVLAMCHIAKKTDEIMIRLGVGTGKTGGGLLKEAIGAGRMAGNTISDYVRGVQRRSKKLTLGSTAGTLTNVAMQLALRSYTGQAVGGAGKAMRAGSSAWIHGESLGNAAKAATDVMRKTKEDMAKPMTAEKLQYDLETWKRIIAPNQSGRDKQS